MKTSLFPVFLSFMLVPALFAGEAADGLLQEILDKPEIGTVSADKGTDAPSGGDRRKSSPGKIKGKGTSGAPRASLGEAAPLLIPKSPSPVFPASLESDGEEHSFLGKRYWTVAVGRVNVDHSCMSFIRKGEWNENLDGKGWSVGGNFHKKIGSVLELDSSVSYSLVSIGKGAIGYEGERRILDDSDCNFWEGSVLLQVPFRSFWNFRGYVGAGLQAFRSGIDYDRDLTYWYGRKEKGRVRTIEDTEMAPCLDLGVEWSCSKFVTRLDIICTTGMKDIWRSENSDDEENLIFSVDCGYSLSDRMFLLAGLRHSKAVASKDAHVGLGMEF